MHKVCKYRLFFYIYINVTIDVHIEDAASKKGLVDGHTAPGTLSLLKHFTCSLAVQQRLSRAPCSLWLSSCAPVTAARVKTWIKRVGNSTKLLWGCVLPSTDPPGVDSLLCSILANPPCCKASCDFLMSFSLSAVCNSHQRYQLQGSRNEALLLCSALFL